MRRAVHTAWRQLGDETVVVNLRDRRIVGLDAVGGWIWSLLDGRDLAEIESAVAGLDGATQDQAAEVHRFLIAIEEIGLVQRDQVVAGAGPAGREPDVYRPPQVRWSEPLEQAAASCGFISGQTPLCTQVPAI